MLGGYFISKVIILAIDLIDNGILNACFIEFKFIIFGVL